MIYKKRVLKILTATENVVYSIFTRFLFLIALFLLLNQMGCNKEEYGECTVNTTGGDLVYPNITYEQCQNVSYNAPNVTGWKWEPND